MDVNVFTALGALVATNAAIKTWDGIFLFRKRKAITAATRTVLMYVQAKRSMRLTRIAFDALVATAAATLFCIYICVQT